MLVCTLPCVNVFASTLGRGLLKLNHFLEYGIRSLYFFQCRELLIKSQNLTITLECVGFSEGIVSSIRIK